MQLQNLAQGPAKGASRMVAAKKGWHAKSSDKMGNTFEVNALSILLGVAMS